MLGSTLDLSIEYLDEVSLKDFCLRQNRQLLCSSSIECLHFGLSRNGAEVVGDSGRHCHLDSLKIC